jgi:Na+-driven multidrug efflux pump
MFFHWHVVGVALGTVLSQAVSALLVVRDLCKNKYGVHYQIKKTRFYKKELNKILTIGIPMGLNGAFFSISNLLIQSSINAYGGMAIAGNTVAVNIEAFGDSFPVAIENAAVTFVGQNVGAGKIDRVPRILGACLFASLIVQLFFSAIYFLVGKYLCMLFNSDPIVIEWALKRLFVVGATYVFTTLMRGYGSALKGMGYSLSPMLATLFFTCVVRVFYVLCIYANFSAKIIQYIYIIYPITWILTGFCLMAIFHFVWARERKTPILKQENAQSTETTESQD